MPFADDLQSLFAARQAVVDRRNAQVAEAESQLARIEKSIGSMLATAPAGFPAPPPLQRASSIPRPAAVSGSIVDLLLWYLTLHGGKLDFGACATELLEEDTPDNRQRLHRALSYLKKTRRVLKKGWGVWQVREQKRMGRPPKQG